jgi:hypothetical protein
MLIAQVLRLITMSRQGKSDAIRGIMRNNNIARAKAQEASKTISLFGARHIFGVAHCGCRWRLRLEAEVEPNGNVDYELVRDAENSWIFARAKIALSMGAL